MIETHAIDSREGGCALLRDLEVRIAQRRDRRLVAFRDRALRHGRPIWYLAPAAVSLVAFTYLLSLHPTAAGRTYAAYGGVYVAAAVG
jgi:hypothetical protein